VVQVPRHTLVGWQELQTQVVVEVVRLVLIVLMLVVQAAQAS